MDQWREGQFFYYVQFAAQLSRAELELHAKISNRSRRRLVEKKKALLFKRMCADAGIQDVALAHQLLSGLPLVGVVCTMGEFLQKGGRLH